MPVMLVCPTCALKEKVDDDEVGEAKCPHCDELLGRPKSKSKPRPADDEDERPTKKKPARKKREDDEVEDKGRGGNPHDGAVAAKLGLKTGFDDRELVGQVEDELGVGEVLHYACRPSEAVSKWQAIGAGLGAMFFAFVGLCFLAVVLAGGLKSMGFMAYLVPGLFVLFGTIGAVFAPVKKLKSARKSWYAVTGRRAIVFEAGFFGRGKVTTYRPFHVRNMRLTKSWLVKGAGSLIFRTEVRETIREVRTSTGTRTERDLSITHYGFLGIDDVEKVEDLIREVLLSQVEEEDED